MRPLLNIDAGESDDEPEELYALADVVHVACGGHAGDEESVARVVEACKRLGTRVGAHPSYEDRDSFGRRAIQIPLAMLTMSVHKQCRMLRGAATSVKLHGALYHAAHAHDDVAEACISGITSVLGEVVIVGLAGGAMERATICVHGDTPGALVIARAVREALDA